MPEDRTKRKLAAILSADVVGYSRLMEDDEEATVRTINAYRGIVVGHIRGESGRVVDAKGDNILAEFPSVVDAVRCAVMIQRELGNRNVELPERRKMEFRIGVNLGDVIEDKETIYGDGVNIAARLEALADPGGVCISGATFDSVVKKLSLGYEFVGEQQVKNIERPIRVYKVLSDPEHAGKVIGEKRRGLPKWQRAALAALVGLILLGGGFSVWNYLFRPPDVEPASMEKMAFPLPDKPSIVVLPFDNLTGDPEQDYVADGMTENIISSLSKISELFVIARNSSFTYKGKPTRVQQVAEQLGVRHILEGSVQKSDIRVRITAQLIDALTGHHLWSEQFDRELKDLFLLQDEITKEIAVALQVELTHGEQARIWHKTTDNMQAWGYCVKAISLYEHFTKEDNIRARQLLEQAVQLDPDYAYAWTLLAWTHFVDVRLGFGNTPSESLKQAVELARKASALDDTLPDVHALWNTIYLVQRQYEKAIAEGEKSIALAPNNACAHALQAQTMMYLGRSDEAVSLAERAIRLSPYYPAWYLLSLGGAYRNAGRCGEAITAFTKLLERSKQGEFNVMFAHINLAGAYANCSRAEEAKAQVNEVLRINPNLTAEFIDSTSFYQDPNDLIQYKESLREAGLPEHPSLPFPDQPSVAVLPFENMSGDPEQEYFSDGITEEIITALSKTPKLFVIARNSTFTYKGKPVKIQQVGRELGVQYVLEGSVRKAEDRVRVTAQLVDTSTGKHLWAERYDRDLRDVFAVQDEITRKIIVALQVELTEGEQARLSGKATSNLGAYLLALQAREQFYRMNKQGSMRARELAREAIELDEEYATPHVTVALTHMMDLWFNFTDSPQESMRLASEAAQKALALDDSDPGVYVGLCMLYIMQRQHEKAIAAGERSVALSPSGASAHSSLGIALLYADRLEEAIAYMKKAITLNPFPPSIYLRNLGSAYRIAGRHEEAIAGYKKSLQQSPDDLFTHLGLAICYVSMDRKEEARAEAAEVLRIHPGFSLEHLAKTLPYKNQCVIDDTIANLRKAGLK